MLNNEKTNVDDKFFDDDKEGLQKSVIIDDPQSVAGDLDESPNKFSGRNNLANLTDTIEVNPSKLNEGSNLPSFTKPPQQEKRGRASIIMDQALGLAESDFMGNSGHPNLVEEKNKKKKEGQKQVPKD